MGRLDNGSPYIVMEHLQGADLRTVLKKRGRLPAHEAIHYALQACEALAEAHAIGIVHRDLKPANLFLTTRTDGTPCIKVLDFGISKVLGAADLEMTKTQTVLGSPSYMSPEQMRSPRNVDARTDIWALGVILYRLLTGELPFRADSVPELVTKVALGAPNKPSSIVPELPPELDAVILRCFERDLGRRYANVGDLSSALLPFAPSEARASIERIARVLASASHGRGALPSVPRVTPVDRTGASVLGKTSPMTVSAATPSAAGAGQDGPSAVSAQTSHVTASAPDAPTAGPRPSGQAMRGTSGDAWVNTAFGGGTIAVHRWKLWAIVAAAGSLALGGVVALVVARVTHPTMGGAEGPPQTPLSVTMGGAQSPPQTPLTALPVVVAAGGPVATVAPAETAAPPAVATSAPTVVKGPMPVARGRAGTKGTEPPPPTAPPVVPPAPPAAAPTAAHRMFGTEN